MDFAAARVSAEVRTSHRCCKVLFFFAARLVLHKPLMLLLLMLLLLHAFFASLVDASLKICIQCAFVVFVVFDAPLCFMLAGGVPVACLPNRAPARDVRDRGRERERERDRDRDRGRPGFDGAPSDKRYVYLCVSFFLLLKGRL